MQVKNQTKGSLRTLSKMFSDLAEFNSTFNLSYEDFLLDNWDDILTTQTLSPAGFVVISVILGFIMTFGFLNNFIVLILFCKFRTLRTPVNMLLLNISVSDMLTCLCGTTLSFTSSIKGRWSLGKHGCSWYGFINSCFGIVSLISLVVLSYDRYSTLTVYHKQGLNYRRPLLAVAGIWSYSLLWTLPPLFGWSSYGLEGAGTSCSVSWKLRTTESHAYIICLFIFCLGLPVLIMVYCYTRLLLAVKQVGKIRRTAARKREYHVLFMVLATVVCFLLCWTPYGVVAMMATFGQPGLITPIASVVPSLLAKSSTVINPIIYILMNKHFKKCFLILIGCRSGHAESSQSSKPSKTTIIHLNRRIYSKTVPQDSLPQGSSCLPNNGCSTAEMDKKNPPKATS